MNYRAVFCDIDGTLLTTDKRLLPDTVSQVRRLDALGIPFILVSARMPAGVYPTQNRLGIKAPLICGGGALVLSEDREILYETGLPFSYAERIRKAFPETDPDFIYGVYAGEHWITEDASHPEIKKEERITEVMAEEGNTAEFLSSDAIVHKFLCMGKPSLLDETAERLSPMFPEASFCKSAPHLLEVIRKGCSKSAAIRFLCERMGISPEECIAFGDNYNDVDMLECVGLGVAMGNAPEAVKKAAVRVTDTNDREGVLKMLQTLF